MKRITIIIALFLIVTSNIMAVNAIVIDEFSELVCDANGCRQVLYSYPKYYRDAENNLRFLNESFDRTNCASGFSYCVDANRFQFNAKQRFDSFNLNKGSKTIAFKPNAFVTATSAPLTPALAQASGNTITYVDVLPQLLDVRYTYTWAGVKEEFIVKQNVFSLLPENSDALIDFTLTTDFTATNQGNRLLFADQGAQQFALEHFYAQDAAGRLAQLEYAYNANSFQLKIPVSFLRNASYPVVIDPSITFTSAAVTFDGFLSYNGDSDTYIRYRSGAGLPIKVGDDSLIIMGISLYRGVIEWNTQSLPKNATIQDINLTLYFAAAADQKNENVYIRTMDGNATSYPDNKIGNQNYYADMGNGTILLNTTVNSIGFRSYNLTAAGASDLFNKRLAQAWWGIGFHTLPEDATGITPQQISAANDANVSRRPVLTITYAQATEAEGDAAIEQGINNALASPTIYSEPYVATRKTNNTQQLGKFDRVASSGGKRWAFNYVSSGESFTQMTNLSTTVFVFEITNLAAEEIRQQVEQYINATKSL